MLRVECGKLNNARSKGLLRALKMSLGESRVDSAARSRVEKRDVKTIRIPIVALNMRKFSTFRIFDWLAS